MKDESIQICSLKRIVKIFISFGGNEISVNSLFLYKNNSRFLKFAIKEM